MLRLLLPAFCLTVTLGCGDKGPTARQTAKPVETRDDTPQSYPHAEPPGTSEAASKMVVEKILKAHTNNEPHLMEKLKSIRMVWDGQMTAGQGGETRPVKFEFQAIWPGMARYSAQGLIPGLDFTYLHNNGTVSRKHEMPPVAEGEYESTARDIAGNWHLLLVPLSDSETIVAPGPDAVVDGLKCASIRVWKKGLTPAILAYDPVKYLVRKVTYPGIYPGVNQGKREVLIELLIHEHATAKGFVYPTRMTVRHAGTLLMTVTKTELEFPKEYAKDAFAKP